MYGTPSFYFSWFVSKKLTRSLKIPREPRRQIWMRSNQRFIIYFTHNLNQIIKWTRYKYLTCFHKTWIPRDVKQGAILFDITLNLDAQFSCQSLLVTWSFFIRSYFYKDIGYWFTNEDSFIYSCNFRENNTVYPESMVHLNENYIPARTKHLHNIYTTSVHLCIKLYKWVVFDGIIVLFTWYKTCTTKSGCWC